jgi:dTDP-4-amino-4,6-dideoxygalactose transaminase
MEIIPFNKPFIVGKELDYIRQSVESGKISGDGLFTAKCHRFFEQRYGFGKALLTTSCTDALEMAAILCNIQPGDEVIVPSYTFVSTANAFVMRGAKVVFADSRADHPGVCEKHIAQLVTAKTKVIVVVHYAGLACNMDAIMALANERGIYVIEDAAHAIDSFYINSKGEQKALGSIGHMAAFSFHETKNVISGEGGMLVINEPKFIERAEIIREKGTDRSKFFRGEIDKYGWVDIGSSYLPSDMLAAFLYAQLEHLDDIQQRRIAIWNRYAEALKPLSDAGKIKLPAKPDYATNNAHIFYLLCADITERDALIAHLRANGIVAVFHYVVLHQSKYFAADNTVPSLPNSEYYGNTLLRLPMYFELTDAQVDRICQLIADFYSK